MGCEVTNRIQKEAPAEEGKDLLSTHRANEPRKNRLKLQEGLLRPSTRLANNKQKAFKNICWASLTVGRRLRQSLLAHPKGYIQSYDPMTSAWHLNLTTELRNQQCWSSVTHSCAPAQKFMRAWLALQRCKVRLQRGC